VCRLLGKTGPHLVLFCFTRNAEGHIGYPDEENDHSQLKIRKGSEFAEQVGVAKIEVLIGVVSEVYYDAVIFIFHLLQRFFKEKLHVQPGGVQVSVCQDFSFIVCKNNRYLGVVLKHLQWKKDAVV